MPRPSTSGWLLRMARAIVNGAAFLSYICVGAMLLVVIANVLMRYLVRSALFWGDEVMIHLMILMAYAAAGIVLGEGKHIRMTAVFDRLSGEVQKVLWVVMSLIGAGYAGFVTYAMIVLTLDTLQIGTYSGNTGWPVAPWQMVIAIGLFSMTVAFIMLAVVRVAILFGIGRESKGKEEAILAD